MLAEVSRKLTSVPRLVLGGGIKSIFVEQNTIAPYDAKGVKNRISKKN